MKNPMRDKKPQILYIVTGADRGGAQMHLLDLADGMRPDIDPTVAVGEEGFLPDACRARRIPVHILPSLKRSQHPGGDLAAFFQICRLLRQIKPDLVHIHTFKAGIIGRAAGWWMRVPSIYTMHAWLWDTDAVSGVSGVFGRAFERIAANFCKRIITVSEAGEKILQELGIGARENTVTIRNGIPDCASQATHGARQSPVIVMVARFMPPKRQETLLRAFAAQPAGPRLRFIGDGVTRPAVERLACQLGIANRVEFLGERGDVPALLAESDIFVLASAMEMLPISILEAMRAGLPVIASDVGGIREAVIHGVTGLLVEEQSVTELAHAVQLLVQDAGLRARLGTAARQSFLKRFQFLPMAERTQKLYWEVLNERYGPRAVEFRIEMHSGPQPLVEPARSNESSSI